MQASATGHLGVTFHSKLILIIIIIIIQLFTIIHCIVLYHHPNSIALQFLYNLIIFTSLLSETFQHDPLNMTCATKVLFELWREDEAGGGWKR